MTAWLTISAAAWVAGCAPQAGVGRKDAPLSPAQVAQLLEPNVVGVAAMYDAYNPWLKTKNGARVCGVRLTLFLFGPENKSVFGDGVIRPRLFLAERDRSNRVRWPEQPAKEWSYTVEDAVPFRGLKPKVYGWYYGLFLHWGDLDLSGKEIRLIITFERADGQTISSDVRDMRVPSST